MKINFSISEDNYYVQKCVRIYQSLVAVISITSKCRWSFLIKNTALIFVFLQMWITFIYNTIGK